MNSLRQSARWVRALPRVANHTHSIKHGSRLGPQFRRGLATHASATRVNLTSETRSITKVEKIILDTIKVCLRPPRSSGVE